MHRLVFGLLPLLAAGLPAQDPSDAPFRAAADYSKDHHGLAVLVYDDGALVFEQYQNGHKASKPHHIYSGTKSFAPMVALVAQDEGLLKLDEPVFHTITEWKGDKRREKITIRHLLDFTSGLRINDRELHSSRTADKYEAAIACEAATEPGRRFRYGSCHLMVFGELMKRKLAARNTKTEGKAATDFVDYLKHRILDPIDCEIGFWLRDRARNPALPYGAFLTARNWGKFGLLVLNRGRHEDKQLIPTADFDACFQGTRANPIYGLNFWLVGKYANKRNPQIPKDTVSAAGMYNQKLYIIPSKKRVVVRYGKTNVRSRYNDVQFLGRLFAEGGTNTSKKSGAQPKQRRPIIR